MELENRYLYPLFKMVLGLICLILSLEYVYSYCVYQAASFGIMYIGDAITWFFAGGILFTEGLRSYLQEIREEHGESLRLRAAHRA
jgi:hypothetical protein